jgi:AraC family transcriptional activator of pobA
MIATYNKISALADIKIVRFDVNKRYTKPHKHNKYLELVYFIEGEGVHYMDLVSYEIKLPVVFLINKNEVHNWEINTIPKGYVIILKEGFLEKTIDKYINKQLLKLSESKEIKIPKEEASIGLLFEILCDEMKQNSDQQEFIEGILKALLSKIINHANVEDAEDVIDKGLRFIALLEETLKNNVAFYAEALNITPQNLNKICHKKYGKTSSLIIADYLIKEVKRLLLFTDNSVSEIAFKLDFKDVSHFVKYFKRHTGITPLQFKNNT